MRQIVVILNLFLLVVGSLQALADERMPRSNPQQVTLKLSEYRFEPAQVTFRAGQQVELILVNEGTVMHEFITDALKKLEVDVEINGVVAEAHGLAELEIPPKSKAVLHFRPEKPGEFPIACHAKEPKDHLKEGMSGKLVFK